MITRQEEALVRAAVYNILSLAFLYPADGAHSVLLDSAARLGPIARKAGFDALARALERLRQALEEVGPEALEDQYAAVFGHAAASECAPYEGEYGQAHVFQKSQTLADLGAFYQAFGVKPNPAFRDRLDHISVEMEFMNLLTLKEAHSLAKEQSDERAMLCVRAQESFLANHLASWINAFQKRLARRAGGTGVYAAVAELLDVFMESEFRRFRLDATPLAPNRPEAAREEDLGCAVEDPLTLTI